MPLARRCAGARLRLIEPRTCGVERGLRGVDPSLAGSGTSAGAEELDDVLGMGASEHTKAPAAVATDRGRAVGETNRRQDLGNCRGRDRRAWTRRGDEHLGERVGVVRRTARAAQHDNVPGDRISHCAVARNPGIEDAGRVQGGFDVGGLAVGHTGADVDELVERPAARRIALSAPMRGCGGSGIGVVQQCRERGGGFVASALREAQVRGGGGLVAPGCCERRLYAAVHVAVDGTE